MSRFFQTINSQEIEHNKQKPLSTSKSIWLVLNHAGQWKKFMQVSLCALKVPKLIYEQNLHKNCHDLAIFLVSQKCFWQLWQLLSPLFVNLNSISLQFWSRQPFYFNCYFLHKKYLLRKIFHHRQKCKNFHISQIRQ